MSAVGWVGVIAAVWLLGVLLGLGLCASAKKGDWLEYRAARRRRRAATGPVEMEPDTTVAERDVQQRLRGEGCCGAIFYRLDGQRSMCIRDPHDGPHERVEQIRTAP